MLLLIQEQNKSWSKTLNSSDNCSDNCSIIIVLITKIIIMETNEKCIHLLNSTNNAIKDCIDMLNNIERLDGIIDDNVLKQVRTIQHKAYILAYNINTELESINGN